MTTPATDAGDGANPVLQRELLEYVLDSASTAYDCVDVREFTARQGYDRREVAEALDALNDVVSRGAVAHRAWYHDRGEVEARLADLRE